MDSENEPKEAEVCENSPAETGEPDPPGVSGSEEGEPGPAGVSGSETGEPDPPGVSGSEEGEPGPAGVSGSEEGEPGPAGVSCSEEDGGGGYEALYTASSPSQQSESEGEETLFRASHPGERGRNQPAPSGDSEAEKLTNIISEERYRTLLEHYNQLLTEKNDLSEQLEVVTVTRTQKETSFQDIIKELEQKCFSQQERLEAVQERLDSERHAWQELEKDLTLKTDQAASRGEVAVRERDTAASKLSLLEEERSKLVSQLTAAELKAREAQKENDKLQAATQKQKSEITKLQVNLEKNEAVCSEHVHELSKHNEEVGSLNIRLKWAQNKLKTETEAHKEAKSQLTVSAKKLKEAREEGDQIRANLKTMIQQYQESEEMQSNSLGIKLKKTEEELKQQEQEIADQQELHQLTVKELELCKASLKISQEECQQLNGRVAELNSRIAEHSTELEELKGVVSKQKQDQKKLMSEMTGIEQLNHGIESERSKFTTMCENLAQLQKSHQRLEKELTRRKDRETELLAFSEKLSSANAGLQAERTERESRVSVLTCERDQLSASEASVREEGRALREQLAALQEDSQANIIQLMQKVDDKSKAVEQLSMSLEDEREQVKAVKKKNSSNIRDLQRQIQSSKKRIEQLESALAAEREAPATLPINESSRASSHASLDGIVVAPPLPISAAAAMAAPTNMAPLSSHNHLHPPPPPLPLPPPSIMTSAQTQVGLSDDERAMASPSPEMFQYLDHEKMMLVEKMCSLKKQLAKMDEKMEFFEEHARQLTEDIQRKSKIIQSFIIREQSGVLAPPSSDSHKAKLSKKGGIMATVFSPSGRHDPDITLDLSLEMNRKMQSVLEDILLKNITLKESIDTLGQEIQRLSAQLQSHQR